MTMHEQISAYSVLALKSGFVPDRNESIARRTLQFFYFDAGGGHRSAATALRDVIEEQFPHWNIELVDLFSDVLRPLDPLHRMRKIYRVEDLYNGILKRGWTYGFTALLRMQQKLIKLYTPGIEDLLRRHWQAARPDLVVSFVPHFNDIMIRTLRETHARAPYVTVMTDLADCPPNFWQGKQDHFIVCGSDMAVRQAKAGGYRAERIFKTSGMILKPHFYRQDNVYDRRAERRKLGLDPDLPTAIIMFGGNGAKDAAAIASRLRRGNPRVQCIVMCGRNEKLRRQLAKKKFCHAVGFTADKVSYYMRLADFFIGKPGPGSVSEALHMGLPVIVEYNRRTMPQERYNALWIKEQELGLTVKSFVFIASAVRNLLKGGRLEKFRGHTRRFKNRAVYEIPEMLASILVNNFH
jgi:UDP-N-acetylglucosamine:LPS N-acetylglucosamine transferase